MSCVVSFELKGLEILDWLYTGSIPEMVLHISLLSCYSLCRTLLSSVLDDAHLHLTMLPIDLSNTAIFLPGFSSISKTEHPLSRVLLFLDYFT